MLPETETLRERAFGAIGEGRYWAAIGEAMKALTVHSNLPWPYYAIGISLASLGRKPQATGYLRRYLDLDRSKFARSRKMAAELLRHLESVSTHEPVNARLKDE
jgi:tetratricopeptide (TPR) repeat protein